MHAIHFPCGVLASPAVGDSPPPLCVPRWLGCVPAALRRRKPPNRLYSPRPCGFRFSVFAVLSAVVLLALHPGGGAPTPGSSGLFGTGWRWCLGAAAAASPAVYAAARFPCTHPDPWGNAPTCCPAQVRRACHVGACGGRVSSMPPPPTSHTASPGRSAPPHPRPCKPATSPNQPAPPLVCESASTPGPASTHVAALASLQEAPRSPGPAIRGRPGPPSLQRPRCP